MEVKNCASARNATELILLMKRLARMTAKFSDTTVSMGQSNHSNRKFGKQLRKPDEYFNLLGKVHFFLARKKKGSCYSDKYL